MFNFLTLRIGLVIGGFVDVGGGLMLLLRSTATEQKLGLTITADPFWPSYTSVFLFILPVFYWLTAYDPARYLGNVAVAAFGRTLGFLFYLYYWLHGGGDRFLSLALMNVAFAGWYAWELRRIGWPTL